MKLKVCGVRDMKMIQTCQDESVDYIGFNFVPSSKRFITLEQAQPLSQSFTGRKVAVFQNPSLGAIIKALALVDFDTVQLHGHEPPEFIDDLRAELPELKVWKAFGVDENFDENILQSYSKNCDLLLFDSKVPGSGTQISATNLLQSALEAATKLHKPYAIAGGINPETLATTWQQFPEAEFLDTASGVEDNDQFSADKLRQMCTLLRDE